MRKKTPNAGHRTPNIEWAGDGRIGEDPPVYSPLGKRDSTLNTQRQQKRTPNIERRTPNIEWRNPRLRVKESPDPQYSGKKEPKYDLEDRLLDFAVNVVELTEALPSTRAGNHIAGQLLRSGTSPYGNHGEVESAESRKDFIHKLKVCLKELRETRRWLRLVARLKRINSPANLGACLNEAEELIRIFVASIRTAERNDK
jgi:four helix bundle protein